MNISENDILARAAQLEMGKLVFEGNITGNGFEYTNNIPDGKETIYLPFPPDVIKTLAKTIKMKNELLESNRQIGYLMAMSDVQRVLLDIKANPDKVCCLPHLLEGIDRELGKAYEIHQLNKFTPNLNDK